MRGGYRPGAGRKPNPETLRARELIKQAVPDDDWLQIFQGLAATAMTGERGAAQCAGLLLRYGFGLPQVDVTEEDDKPMAPVVKQLAAAPKARLSAGEGSTL